MQRNILDYFLISTSKNPDAICIQNDRESYSYASTLRKSFEISFTLKERQNCPVVILLPKSEKSIFSILACMMTGNIYVPVDVSAPIDRLGKIITSLGLCVVLFDERTQALSSNLQKSNNAVFINIDNPNKKEPLEISLNSLSGTIKKRISNVINLDPAYIIFTSGSTGTPKGVTICHNSIVDYIDWANSIYSINANDVIGSQAPLYFDNSTLDLYLAFSNGACFHIINESVFIFPAKLLEYLNNTRITTVFWVPSILVTIANLDLLSSIKLQYLKNVFFAGEVMPAKHLKYWMKHHPGALYSNLYGPTEITVDCTYFNVPQDWSGDEVPIGIPCTNTDILILDDQDKVADAGELCVRGSSLALGYWGDKEKTDKVFIQNPLNNNYRDLIYRTGDLVKILDGLIYFVGRKDFQIKHNGYRIELGEIENVVANLENVISCVAGYIQEQKTIYLCTISNPPADLSDFRKKLATKLPKYMMPAKIVFMDEFPMTPNGKINRLAIKDKIIMDH